MYDYARCHKELSDNGIPANVIRSSDLFEMKDA